MVGSDAAFDFLPRQPRSRVRLQIRPTTGQFLDLPRMDRHFGRVRGQVVPEVLDELQLFRRRKVEHGFHNGRSSRYWPPSYRHGTSIRTSSGCSSAYSSINSFVRSSGLPLGTTTFMTRYWSPPATPMPGSRTREPLDVPGGTFTVTR